MAATASRDIHETTVTGEYTDWSQFSIIPSQWRTYRSKIVNISQFGNEPIFICDNETFTVLNRDNEKSNNLRKIKPCTSK
jgi:hypothetical protein